MLAAVTGDRRALEDLDLASTHTLTQKRHTFIGSNESYGRTQPQRDRKDSFSMHPECEELDLIRKNMDGGYLVIP